MAENMKQPSAANKPATTGIPGLTGLNVEPEAEMAGLDVSEVGMPGYAGTEGMSERAGWE